MKIKKLNRTHNVCRFGVANWQVTFDTDEGYTNAIILMCESFGLGKPYGNDSSDYGSIWLYRNKDCSRVNNVNKSHRIYLTTEEQVTFCQLALKDTD